MKLVDALNKVREVMRRKHLALSSEGTYCGWITRFARFVQERCTTGAPEVKMEAFLTQLARQGVAASTQNQAFAAVLFFYREALGGKVGKVDALRAKRPVHLRYARAARPLGLDITPHHLRHAYATHCLNAGQNPRAIQQAMGHAQLETTMGYLHAEAMGVKSPLSYLEGSGK